MALAGKKDVGEEEEEEEEEERGEKEEEKERGEREKGEDARRKILLKRGKHTRLGFLCFFLLLILLLCSCSCCALVGFLLDFFTVVVYEQGLGFIISLEYPRAWTTCRWTRKKTTTRSTPT